ncbi:hypothetical protein [Psychrobacillus psychrotolerans]|uniref:hypothetical protein n=1 Tax=Psychrobacillus psychrotolerans TaxID=126156 RepID=UPI0033149EC2
MSDIRAEIRKSFEGLSREEILNKLLDAGFNVSKGTGKINITENKSLEEEFDFRIVTNYSTKENKIKQGGIVFYDVPLVAV